MKKIGILTFTYGDNFGQRLQNLAVQEILKTFGFEVYTIPQVVPRRYMKLEKEERHICFEYFNNKFIDFYYDSIGKYKIPKGLEAFDFFVVGSDQVWSPYSPDVNWTFFLKFASTKKRIAYAPSMATDNIPKKKKILYRWYMRGFDAISVREKQSKELLKEFVSVSIETLIDPTLMFDSDFWSNYIIVPKYSLPDEYILYYGLGDSNEDEKLNDFAKSKKCSLIQLTKGTEWFNVGPSQFLYLISCAKYVITDSYHGMIFSILYHKPVYYLNRNTAGINMQSRFETLFSKLDVHLDDGKGPFKKCIIDYSVTNKKLGEERKKALLFLTERFNKKVD